jgi:HTH-type transcriptional regulator/antitoxin HigA
MAIHPIKTDTDYKRALLRIDELMDARPDTTKGEELDVLATLVEVYEREHMAIGSPDPVSP